MPPADSLDVLDPLFRGPGMYAMATLLGALLGSFANVCIYRIPARLSIVSPPSHCFACQAPVRWFDNVPILSFLWLRGRCRACGATFSIRYWLVEVATAMLVGATYHLCIAGLSPEEPVPHRLARFGAYALFELFLVVVAFIDLDHKKIFDRMTFPAIPVFFGIGQLLGDVSWLDRLIGLAAGYLAIRAISDLYYLLTKREGMGYGDGKLLAVIGALLGWRSLLFTLFGGALLGSVIMLTAMAFVRRGGKPEKAVETAETSPSEGVEADPPIGRMEVPFGPFLVMAVCIYLFLQNSVNVALGSIWTGQW